VRQNGSRDPATVRPRLAEAAAEGLEGIRKTLLDAATGAMRDHWITFEDVVASSSSGGWQATTPPPRSL
jgi:hypothetical protein